MSKSMRRYLPGADESEEEYVTRIRATVLPNFPPNVLSQWLYRHREHALYGELDYGTFIFDEEPQTWATEDIPIENSGAFEAVKNYAAWYDTYAGTWVCEWLCKYMGEHGTWPEPIIFIDNRSGVVRRAEAGTGVGVPYHLLEGHRRLGFFLALKRRNALAPAHKVWVASKSG